jgi:hypothetical protein
VAVVDAEAPAPPSAPAPPPSVPVYALEAFAPSGSAPRAVFAIEGGLVVADGPRIGRIAGDGIEWIGKVPKTTPGLGDNVVEIVTGRLPDSVGAIYETSQGRAPSPTFFAITGKATTHTEAAGGGWGVIHPAEVGESTVLAAGSTFDGFHIVTVRGPRVPRRLTPAQGVCKPGETIRTFPAPEANPAVEPVAFASTAEGSLVSLGTLCEKRGAAAEIWDKGATTSRIVALRAWWPEARYGTTLLRGSGGDELWAFTDPFQPVLRYAGGRFEALPMLEAPIENVFVSPTGDLHAYTSAKTLYRFGDGKWTPVGRTVDPPPAPRGFSNLALDASGGLWAGASDKVYRLRETSRAPAPTTEACSSWLVYLYTASSTNGTSYGYPTTKRALASFPEAADIGLVEFGRYPRYLGVTVKSKAQGDALARHVQATMKDESPRVFCHAPDNPRRIP